ncbi:MAG: sigma factor-like helix-turn-helix DNA-binding protein [Actinomycetota bacterium]
MQDAVVGADIDVERGEIIEAVYREHGPRLWRALRLATGNPDVASEAVAEAFAQLIGRGEAVRDPEAWVWRAGFRLAMGEMRRASKALPLPDELPRDAPEPLVDLERALRVLTAHQRTAVVLANYAGWSHREIAEVLDSTSAAVAVHVHRARRRLRTLLEEHDA